MLALSGRPLPPSERAPGGKGKEPTWFSAGKGLHQSSQRVKRALRRSLPVPCAHAQVKTDERGTTHVYRSGPFKGSFWLAGEGVCERRLCVAKPPLRWARARCGVPAAENTLRTVLSPVEFNI